MHDRFKVSIIGAGNVGAMIAYTLANRDIVRDIVLVDINEKKAQAEALDIAHGSYFFCNTTILGTSDYTACKDSDIVVIAVGGAPLIAGKMTRTDLGEETYKIISSFLPDLVKITPNSIFLFVTNPVDVITTIARNTLAVPPNRIIGSGTVLDTVRLRYLINKRFSISLEDIHAYVLGEHGESSFPLWSGSRIGPVHVDDWKTPDGKIAFTKEVKDELAAGVVNGGYKVLEGKGVTSCAIALSAEKIINTILSDACSLLPVSVPLECYPGFEDVSLSLPTMVGKDGIIRIVDPNCSKDEEEKLFKSAQKIQKDYDALVNGK